MLPEAWIVTRQPHLRLQLPELLRAWGWQVRLYQAPGTALRALRLRTSPQLVVLDAPALDVLAGVRRQARFVHLAVVVLLSAGEMDCEQVLRQGADGCGLVPVQPDLLQPVLRAAVRRRRPMAA